MVSKTVHLNCTAERMIYLYIYFLTSSYFVILWEGKMMQGVHPLGYRLQFMICFLAARQGVSNLGQILGRRSKARESACVSFLFPFLPDVLNHHHH